MPTRAYIHSRSGSRDGLALITVLAFVVLLAILIVSFIAFSRLNRVATASYSKSIQAQEIAQGGIQDILTDLHQEIIAGSTNGAAYTVNGTTVYPPSTNWTAVPARFGYATNLYGTDISTTNLPPTLVRVSRASQDGTPTDFYPTLPNYYTSGLMTNRASNANSSTASASGRSVSAARWNKIDLLSTNSAPPQVFATNTPDWVYVTRGGSRACTTNDLTSTPNILPSNNLTNSDQVVGRYAYVVYDEGALLDINSVGYTSSATNNYTTLTNSIAGVPPTNSYTNPTAPTTGITQMLTSKAYTSYADLTQVPGFSAGGQAKIDSFIQWRNASAKTTGAGGGTNYFQAVAMNATNGFLVAHTSANGTDSPLVSRQDMLNYLASVDPSGTSIAQAAPYLGTFTRAGNAPSWTPTADSQNLSGYYGLSNTNGAGYAFNSTYFGKVAYKDNAETSGTANRDVPNVRYTTGPQTITHYNDDGTSYTYTVNAGDPVVQHRFSLAKIAWLGTTGPSSTAFNPSLTTAQKNAAILACFGLVWQPQNFAASPLYYDRWNYQMATTSNVHILALDEVAAGCTATANPGYREPNFFEMLKAGILAGSLGQSPGPVSPGPVSGTTHEGPVSTNLDSFNTEKNRHILQIGANIIDQFDSDSIPTALYLQIWASDPSGGANAFLTEDDLAFNTVYGDENLPGLTHLTQQVMEDWYDTANKVGAWKTYIYPEIWNIHQTPATGTTLQNHPTQFRIHAYGKIVAENNPNGNQPPGYTQDLPPGMDFDDTTTGYPFYNASSSVPPAGGSGGTSGSITGGQIPSSVAVTIATAATSPAGLVYFTDNATAASPYYRFPDYLQWANLYAGGGYISAPTPGYFANGPGFRGTALVNIATDPNDDNLPADGAPANWRGNKFAALFAGEDALFPNWSVITGTYTVTQSGVSTAPGAFEQYNLRATNPLFVSIECQDPVTLNWHPYNFISRLTGGSPTAQFLGDNTSMYYSSTLTSPAGTWPQVYSYVFQNYLGTPGSTFVGGSAGPPVVEPTGCAANGQTNLSGRGGIIGRPDPRTDRFSDIVARVAQDQQGAIDVTMNPHPPSPSSDMCWAEDYFPWRTFGFVYIPDQGANPGGFGGGGASYIADWAINQANYSDFSGHNAFYVDPDGVVRPGDAYRQNYLTGDGYPLYHGTGGGNPATGNAVTINTSPQASLLPTTLSTAGTSLPIGSAQARRPMILNRPFRSVGELGYAFRDIPFKSIDFFSKYSADGALLDLFSVIDEPTVSAGEVDLSNTPTSILTAIMSGATKMEINAQYAGKYDSISTPAYPTGVSASTGMPNFMTSTEAAYVATSLTSSFTTNGPISNRADLVSRLDPIITNLSNPTTTAGGQGYLDYANKAYAEAPIRALSNVTSTRTWNLLIDIIAQSGQMSPSATSLDNFIVQGEKRYWLHIAIDRYTGKILDQQLETVYE